VNAKNSHRVEHGAKTNAQESARPSAVLTSAITEDMTEEERIAMLYQDVSGHWEQQKQQMANAKPVFNRSAKQKPHVPDHDPPKTYVCKRCEQPGHWIQACPTNGNPEYDDRRNTKKPTGIPRSFLKTVDKPTERQDDGLTDTTKRSSGVMRNADGQYVRAVPDQASWQKYQSKAKAAQEQQKAAAEGSKELRERGLECPLDKQMFVEPMKTPCCEKTYCKDCIETALINSDLVCPNCSTSILIDNLIPDEDMVKRIQKYEEEKVEERKKEASKSPKAANSPSPQPGSHPIDDNKATDSKSPSPSPASPSAKGTPAPPESKTANDKKRPAEDEIDNRIPKEPKSMRAQKEVEAQEAVKDPNVQFLEQMSQQTANLTSGTQNFPGVFNGVNYPNQMNMMNGAMSNGMMPMGMSMPGMMNMSNGMMNPMMANGWNNMNGMSGMNGMNPMGMPMGMNNMSAMNGMNMNGMGGMNGMNPANGMYGGNMGGGFHQQNGMYRNNYNYGRGMNNMNRGNGAWPGQQPPNGNEEDNAYMRNPVNPHRQANRNRRVQRPADYRTL
jgi:protein MPE1